MRDLLGIAVAVVIALLSQIVQPWSRAWWSGMIVAGIIAALAAVDLGWRETTFFSSVTTASPPSANDRAREVILDVTPDYLMELYKDHTSVQADKLASIYIGKLIPISGPLGNVSGPTYGPKDFKEAKMFVALADNTMRSSIYMYFNIKWKERLEVMARKQNISAVCEVAIISSLDLELDNCDFRD